MKSPTSSDKRLRLFENRWLETLTVISVGWFVAIWSGVLAWLGFSAWGSASALEGVALIGLGWLMFTMLEYTLHRFVFHWKPKSEMMAKVVFIMHGNHHVEPTDKLRSLMPPVVSFPIGFAVAALFDATMGTASGWAFFGFVMGYVAYDLTHYASHQWPMSSRLGQRFKRYHLKHHFIAEHGNYAVTGLFWDRVFGTQIKLGERRTSQEPKPLNERVLSDYEAVEPAE
ncbi:MAG: sterol desaturase family protein [Pseudomonadota bacterium]